VLVCGQCGQADRDNWDYLRATRVGRARGGGKNCVVDVAAQWRDGKKKAQVDAWSDGNGSE